MRSSGSGKENGVRIRLQIDLADPALAKLAGLPWELLYNDVTRQALGRSRFTPIIRSLDVAQPYVTPPFQPPLRVLLVLANPEGTHALGLDREKQRIEEVMAALDDVEVEVVEHATKRSLYDRLDAGRFHVLHYMGHGGFDADRGGVLLLEDGRGGAAPLSARLLGDDLAERRAMRLVFLNACDTGRTSQAGGVDPFTGVASSLVAAGIPAVVAMQVPIADRAAFEFAGTFYAQIARGEPVDAAVAVGRRAIYRSDPASLEWATPVLFMRSEGGDLFATPDTPEAAAPPPLAADPPPRAQPVRREQAPPPAPSFGQRVKKRTVATLSGLGALVLVLFSAEAAGCFNEEYIYYGEPDGDYDIGPPLADGPMPGGGPPPFTPDAQALMVASGFGDILGDDELANVAEGLVQSRFRMQQEGFASLREVVLSLPPNATQSEPVGLEPGGYYVVLGSCDDDCERVSLQLYDANGTLVLQDSGKEPVLDVAEPRPGDHVLTVGLDECSTPECFVGVGVYRDDSGY